MKRDFVARLDQLREVAGRLFNEPRVGIDGDGFSLRCADWHHAMNKLMVDLTEQEYMDAWRQPNVLPGAPWSEASEAIKRIRSKSRLA